MEVIWKSGQLVLASLVGYMLLTWWLSREGVSPAVTEVLRAPRPAPILLSDWPVYGPDYTTAQPVVWLHALGDDAPLRYLTQAAFTGFNYGTHYSRWSPGHWVVHWGSPVVLNRMFGHKENFLYRLDPGCKVNTIPGGFILARKVNLMTSRDIGCAPLAFRLPEEKGLFLEHAESHPDTMWVQKNNKHRGVSIKNISDVDLDNRHVFVQQYIKPFLMFNRKFDIGVYLGITSSEPSRMYLYLADISLKISAKDYHPFDPNDLLKYVETDHLHPRDIPRLSKLFFDLGMKNKKCVEAYLQEFTDLRPGDLDQKILDAAVEVVVAKDAQLSEKARSYELPSYSHFFHLMRADFLLDEDLNMWIIEINSGPNALRTIPQAAEVTEEMIRLMGLAAPFEMRNLSAIVPDDEIEVDHASCFQKECETDCDTWECRVCSKCLNDADRGHLRRAVMENRYQRSWRRIMPPPFKDQQEALAWQPLKDSMYVKLSEKSRFMALWYHRKCIVDPSFCR